MKKNKSDASYMKKKNKISSSKFQDKASNNLVNYATNTKDTEIKIPLKESGLMRKTLKKKNSLQLSNFNSKAGKSRTGKESDTINMIVSEEEDDIFDKKYHKSKRKFVISRSPNTNRNTDKNRSNVNTIKSRNTSKSRSKKSIFGKANYNTNKPKNIMIAMKTSSHRDFVQSRKNTQKTKSKGPSKRRLTEIAKMITNKQHERVLAKMQKKFHIMEVLGQGAFSFIYKAQDLKRDKVVALKITKEKENTLKREYDILRQLDHKNIMKAYGYIREPMTDETILIMEYTGQKTLKQVQEESENNILPEKTVIRYSYYLLTALVYMHSLKISHSDIKTDNIAILEDEDMPKLIDFGFSNLHQKRVSGIFCGTATFMSPEILARKTYSAFKADVWALGVLIFKMLFNEYPYKAKNEQALLQKIRCNDLKFGSKHNASYKMKSFLKFILIDKEEDRPTMKKVFEELCGKFKAFIPKTHLT